MRDSIKEIHERGAELVIVGNGARNFAEAFAEDFDLTGPLFIDPELRAYRAAGLRRGRVELLSPRMPLNALRAMGSGARQEGVQGDAWQLGGVFVIRPNGDLVYEYASREAGDHPPIPDILEALEGEGLPIDKEVERSRAAELVGKGLSKVVDPFIISSFDRTGFRIHQLTFDPNDLDVDLDGKRCLVTGANSGIGFESALALADLGAEVLLLCRNPERGERAADEIRERTGNARVRCEVVDLSSLASVRDFADRLDDEPVDVLIHNAGVLPDEREETDDGLELTFATHVAGPFLLTECLRARLEAADAARIIWVSSGGMYTRRLNLNDPNWEERDYDGVLAYAETKRAQVILAELWARELSGAGVVSNSMHPGWADTPAVESSLPLFHKVTKQILRTPAEGADTVVWLAASEPGGDANGKFFFDRSPRRTHFLPTTREKAADRRRLWEHCRRIARSASEAS